jgi:hypothetical protein
MAHFENVGALNDNSAAKRPARLNERLLSELLSLIDCTTSLRRLGSSTVFYLPSGGGDVRFKLPQAAEVKSFRGER